MRKTITDRRFNQLLDSECRAVATFYQEQVFYEPREYLSIIEATSGRMPVVEELNPGDTELIKVMRRHGAHYALRDGATDPLAIFVVQSGLGLRLSPDGRPLGENPMPVLTIYGVTNDGRYNLAVLPAQWDEDGRLYVLPSDVFHWPLAAPRHLTLDVLPFLEFFRANDDVRRTAPVISGAL